MGCACDKEKVELEGRTFGIRKKIGAGGFSIVYLVEEGRRQFAMKKLVCHSRRDLKRAINEVKLHRQLLGVKEVLHLEASSDTDELEREISDVGEMHAAVEVYLVLQYFRRGTLQDELEIRCAAQRHFEESKVLEIFSDVCEAVRHLHRLQPLSYAHRDLKPANVLLMNEADRGVLMDLGSAEPARVTVNNSKEAQYLQDYAGEHCSMFYRAPELFEVETHSSIDEKSDIWSLGCLLYATCFFVSPFDRVHRRGDSVTLAVKAGNIQIPNDSPYSDDVHQLILQTLQTDPAARPPIEELLSYTRRTLSKLPTHQV